jgi:hypothetical protein
MKSDLLEFGTPFHDFATEIMNKWRDILYLNEFSPIEKLPGQSIITVFDIIVCGFFHRMC